MLSLFKAYIHIILQRCFLSVTVACQICLSLISQFFVVYCFMHENYSGLLFGVCKLSLRPATAAGSNHSPKDNRKQKAIQLQRRLEVPITKLMKYHVARRIGYQY
ncbi:DEHA2E24354p [Debaryomyces hansenii CBS767]|uniref:DEHA2E24354p n=1 Tax=Debaryomyces hansenii (strain ATCC 36239 / CBS 767 / BCRC 21394 / JCM 1990 / NBRC 0083 / IGC 2968) TaxID=284592 RepID=Q6BN60_DEBHA|nr:DEHA2E24354p [Debaryomyces hansenii CBS767]CAG88651.1 DEHA2E24354p [Debaryomyces hansenii CBS767]|eukprot:XP_460360.1 DEHA2E24354p [Debaryomyces hansenii CBS767]